MPPAGESAEFVQEQLRSLSSLLAAGRAEEASARAEILLGQGIAHPLPLRLVAARRQQAGRFEEALALFERWTRIAPDDPAAWDGLARCRLAARRGEAALVAFDRALALDPDHPALLSGKAGALRDLARDEEARALLRRARAVAPGDFDARFNLALLARAAGDAGEARDLAEGLVQDHGQLAAVRWLAARLALDAGDLDAASQHTQAVLAAPGLAPAQRADALLMQSDVLDRQDRPAEAFAAAAEGKAIQNRLFAGRAAGREAEADKLLRLARAFADARPTDWAGVDAGPTSPDAPATHVFLFGFPRSGTTLLEQVLAGSDRVTALEEAPTFIDHYTEFLSTDEGLGRLSRIDAAQAAHWRDRYWRCVAANGGEVRGGVFLDKAPAGALYMPLVAKLFPSAKILFAIRDPRDVALSCFRHEFQMNSMTYAFTTLEGAARCYDANMRMVQAYRAVLPLDILDTRHEALVEDFDGELAKIAAFIGLDVTPPMRDIAGTAGRRTVRTPSADQVRAGLNRQGLGRWRAYARDLAPVRPILDPWAARFGYPPD
jgi:tetratricopeptide (TPR) repeat protein